MARTQRMPRCLALLIGCLTLSLTQIAGAQDSEEAKLLEEVAASAQNADDTEIAISKWEELIADHPSFSRIGNAELNCGKCYLQLSDFQNAITHFKAATQKLDETATVALPESFLFLGYSQYKQGTLIQETDADGANQLFSTATKTFESQLKSFKDFPHNDQVCYFQGLSYEALAKLVDDGSQAMFEKAADSYESMFEFKPDTDFKFDGLFFLGNVYERLEQYDLALSKYREFLKIGSDDPSFTEVKYRTAYTLSQMASKDEALQYQENNREAKQLFQDAAADEEFTFRNDARFQSAVCAHRLGDLKEAAAEYRAIADASGDRAIDAALQAGRILRSLGQLADAEKYLAQVISAGGPSANEAVLQLVNAKLDAGQAEQAYQLATDQLGRSQKDQPFVAELMLRKAESALALESRLTDSPQLFLDLYEAFPEHRLAAEALYSAAFAYLENRKLEESEKLCKDFLEQFPEDKFTPDLLEVRGDVLLLNEEYSQSQNIFEDLVRNYGTHEKVDTWKMRVGVVLNMQEKFTETIQWLTPLADQFETKTEQAEAWHWVGKSHLAKKNFDDAETTLSRSLEADANWDFAKKTMLALSEAQFGANKSDAAEKTLAALKAKFPDSDEMTIAEFRMAESAYASGEFAGAVKKYQAILASSPTWNYADRCKLGLAWSYLELRDFPKAEASFTGVLTDHADSDLVPQALLGRGMCRRQNEDAKEAMKDLEQYLTVAPAKGQRVEASYELGLAQTQLNQSDEAMETFTRLIKDAPQHEFADRFHYELAWLLNNNEETEKSYEQFAIIADRFPDSDLAPEANFKIGERAYAAKEYAKAIEPFRLCMNSGGEKTLREKAAYRIGWCFYKQENFAAAQENFELQVKTFDSGRYFADALFMIAESHYNQGRMEQAFSRYVETKAAIDSGGKVVEKNVWLTMLHGATSGNQSQGFQEALDFADALIESNASDGLKLEGWLEKGLAHKGLSQNAEALTAFNEAAKDRGTQIGAKARCMIGDVLMIQQEHDKAIDAYTNVYYGYGGAKEDAQIDPWQAYAYYHAGLCSFVRIQQAIDDGNKELANKLASDAMKRYEKLLAEHPGSEFAAQAQKNIETIKRISNESP